MSEKLHTAAKQVSMTSSALGDLQTVEAYG